MAITKEIRSAPPVTGTSSALESLEPVFHQDLNRDGVIGLTTKKLIQTEWLNQSDRGWESNIIFTATADLVRR